MFEHIRLVTEGPIAALTLARPEVRNALSTALLAEAAAAAEQAAASEARVLIISGEGPGFCAGADLKLLSSPNFSRDDGVAFQTAAERLLFLLETIPQVVIAQVHGACFTGGLELALACDLIVAAEDAAFADTHAKIGFRPMWGMTQRLPRRIGLQRAKEMSFSARRVHGAEAAAIGLALDAVPLEQLDGRVRALAEAICANNRDSIAAIKTLYRDGQNHLLDDGLRHEATARFRISKT